MTQTTKRAWKLQEFVAHGASVTCVALGHKSGRVMVTGGEDRKVNLWAVGKPNCIMSLTGHTTTVEAVRFGHEEEMVVAGSLSGALKVWNLEEAKIMRTLTGHKSSIKSLDFHPYGDYAASGSLDCNVKLWDIRRKGCIYTYKGHTSSVNCVRFSPDGKWICSAGEDGLLKLWDLTAGRMLTELTEHRGPVNVLEFHPNDLLLASGSSDRTVKFWDLENFNMVSTTDGDSTPVRRIMFHPDGTCLFSCGKDILKVYGWEPSVCYDSVSVNCGEVSDITVTHNQLICASYSQTNVSTYVVDLQRVHPVGKAPVQDNRGADGVSAGVKSVNISHHSGGRRSFVTERPPTQSTRHASIPKEEAEEPTHDKDDDDKDSNNAEIQDPADYQAIFRPRSQISRSPVPEDQPFQPPPDNDASDLYPVHQPSSVPSVAASVPKKVSPTAPPQAPPTSTTSAAGSQTRRTRTAATKTTKASKPPPAPAPAPAPAKAPSPERGVQAEDFIPKAHLERQSSFEPTEENVVQTLTKGHGAMTHVMSGRAKNLQIVRAMWTSGNTKTAVDSAISMNDPAVLVDLLNILNLKSGLWNLELCAHLLPHVKGLIGSKYDSYVITSCNALKIILRNFGPVIKTNLTAPPSVGVDISREERYRRCKACYAELCQARIEMEKRSNVTDKVSALFREVRILMGNLD